jgi:cation transport ATPase
VVKGGGDCLEALGSVETVLLDKTGTITQGKFQILHLQEIGDFKTRREMLELLALLEGPCSHPISATLVKAAQQEAGTLSSTAAAKRVENHCILTGEGVTGIVDGQQVYVGNVRLFERLGMYQALPTAYQGLAHEWNMQGGSVGFVGVAATKRTANSGSDSDDGDDKKGGICGIFCVTDIVRPEAAQVLASLQRHGICVQMLTGDGLGSAMAVAQQVGIPLEHVHARLLPEAKMHHVKGLKTSLHLPSAAAAASGTRFRKVLDHCFSLGGLLRRTPRILFCGDGVNDAVSDGGIVIY